MFEGGEIYFLGEIDSQTQATTPFVKIGLVRESEKRNSEDRIKEHQTGNPRKITTIKVFDTPCVSDVENSLHGRFATQRIGGEWFYFNETQLEEALNLTKSLIEKCTINEAFLQASKDLSNIESNALDRVASEEELSIGLECARLRQLKKLFDEKGKTIEKWFTDANASGQDVSNFFTLTEVINKRKLDKKSLAELEPEIYDRYVTEIPKMTARFSISTSDLLNETTPMIEQEAADLFNAINHFREPASATDSDIQEMHGLFLSMLELSHPLKLEILLRESALKSACAEYEKISGVCTWTRKRTIEKKFEEKQFQIDHPELWEAFSSTPPPTIRKNLSRDRGYLLPPNF